MSFESRQLSDDSTKQYDTEETSSDDNSQSDGNDEVQVKKQPKEKVKKIIDMDPLLQAIVDIGDQIQDHEDNIRRYEQKYCGKNNDEGDSKYFPSKNVRPKTAVLRYKEPLTDEIDELDDISDNDNISESVTKTKIENLKRPKSAILSMSEPGGHNDSSSRMNLSFSNEQVRKIDMENQRLLKKLMRTKASVGSVTKKKGPIRAQSASAINRTKKQQEIERDNMRFLQRLQHIKPTSSLSRSSLLNDHVRHEEATSRISRSAKNRPSSAPLSRPMTGTRTVSKQSNCDELSSISSSSRSSSRRSSMSNQPSDAQKIRRQQQWNGVW